jgi:hypothetical protein
MRLAFAALLACSLFALPALAQDAPKAPPDVHCDLTVGPHDRMAREGDLVIHPGEVVEDAIALHGDVVVLRGARVRGDAVALDGSVRLEEGAEVVKSAVAFGGGVHAGKGSRIQGSTVSIRKDGTVDLVGDSGDGLTLTFSGDPGGLGKKVVDQILASVRACRTDAARHATR